MKEYDNTNRGALFKNERRKTDKHPEYTGEIDVEGVAYRVAGWVRESKQGRKFLSLAITPLDDQPRRAEQKQEEDEIPF
jgi:uncharacterized protein (DUF736 family)